MKQYLSAKHKLALSTFWNLFWKNTGEVEFVFEFILNLIIISFSY